MRGGMGEVGGTSVTAEGTWGTAGEFTGADGTRLFFQTWAPGESRGHIVLVHGFNEHSGRYEHVARYWVEQGLTVWAMDHRGHGRSGGPRSHVNQFTEYVDDLHHFLTQVVGPVKPVLLCQSMGGMVGFRYGLKHPEMVRALVLCSPMFGLQVKPRWFERPFVPLLSRFLPTLLRPAPLEGLSRDPAVVSAYHADPLVGHQATPRWYTEASALMAASRSDAPSLRLPVLVLQGGGDRIVDPEAVRAVFEAIGSPQKAFRLYPGLYHELMNEPERAEVMTEIRNWLRANQLLPTP
jgi:alpha-beta hydrolase superfamily lysophospholipase